MKYEYKKEEKELYGVKDKPEVVDIPKQKFFCIKGIGNPNSEMFAKHIEVLYQLSYTIKMMPRNGFTPNGYFEYTVYPLEGVWSLTEKGIKLQQEKGILDKDEFTYTIMIKQPSFVDKSIFDKALEIASIKKPKKLLNEAFYEEVEEGLSLQILHNGSYDTESESFQKMNDYLSNNNYERIGFIHKEIYLSDARKVAADKLKTILRIKIKKR